jgi:hypothetical protein
VPLLQPPTHRTDLVVGLLCCRLRSPGEEIQNKLQEWLECDKETAFLIASSLLQQGFLFHASMGVFIETSIVSYTIKVRHRRPAVCL